MGNIVANRIAGLSIELKHGLVMTTGHLQSKGKTSSPREQFYGVYCHIKFM